MKLRNKMKSEVYTCPAAKMTINPSNMRIVVRVRSKKFWFSLVAD